MTRGSFSRTRPGCPACNTATLRPRRASRFSGKRRGTLWACPTVPVWTSALAGLSGAGPTTGNALTLPSSAIVASGAGVLVGTIFGVANNAAASGADVVLSVIGIFDLPKATGAISLGAVVYWDNTAKKVTTT